MIATIPVQDLRERALRSLSKLPPFSPILNKLMVSLANEDVSFLKIAELIEKDTVLAGNVLRLVNSALYGRRATINSVRHAISLLGVNKLRNATLGMSVTRLWSQVQTPPGWSMARFNLHSVATGMLADMLSQEALVDYAEGAFAAGLFHDLGRLLIAIGLPEEFRQIAELEVSGDQSRCQCEREILGYTHAELSADALALWNLPEEIRIAVRYHHSPELAQAPPGRIALGRVIHAAEGYVKSIGYQIDEGFPPPLDEAIRRLEGLGLEQALASQLEAFAKEFEAVRALF